MYPTPPHPTRGMQIGGKYGFVDPAISMVRFQSSTAGHRNFTLEMRAKRRQELLYFLFFFGIFSLLSLDCGKNRSPTNAKQMS